MQSGSTSSEIYVSATEDTIKTAKAIVNHLLKSQGIEKTADELFDIHLTYFVRGYCEEVGDHIESEDFLTPEAREEFMEEHEMEEGSEYTTLIESLVIKSRGNDPELKNVATSMVEFFNSANAFEGQQ